jgi:predicted GNAT family acetyltransferase
MSIVKLTCTTTTFRPCSSADVRWLDKERDYPLAQPFWPSESPLSREQWDQAHADGYEYCGITVGGRPAAIAAVWRYSPEAWEVAAVMTLPQCRARGYAKAVVSFATAAVLAAGRIATCTVQGDNVAMIRTAEAVGFQRSG